MKRVSIKREIIVLSVLFVLISACGFFLKYGPLRNYLDKKEYEESTEQMKRLSDDLYSSTRMLMNNEWATVQLLSDALILDNPQKVDDIYAKLKDIQEVFVSNMDELVPIVVDSSGHYYSSNNKHGVIYNIEELIEDNERISSITSVFSENEKDIMFLSRLDRSLKIEDTEIIYTGFFKDFSAILNRYRNNGFSGEAAVYVLNRYGLKLYSDNDKLFEGRNVLSILEESTYLHGNSYELLINDLNTKGSTISNIILNDEEYYLCMHKMPDTDWIMMVAVKGLVTSASEVRDIGFKAIVISMAVIGVVLFISLRFLIKMLKNHSI